MGQPEETAEVEEETPWHLLENSLRSRWRTKLKRNSCGKDCVKRSLISIVPALGWLINYDIKKHLAGDVISGKWELIIHDYGIKRCYIHKPDEKFHM